MSEKNKNLLIGINEKPSPKKWFFLSFQHVFAMFGATILVPILTGMPISVALFASGLGTIIYLITTNFKVPVYLGSSFAYIGAVVFAKEAMGGDPSAALTGLMAVGFIYIIVSIIIKFTGKSWLEKLLPPIVIGPMIAIIGLGLASTAIANAGLSANAFDYKHALVALVTFGIVAIISTKAKGFLKIVPFLIGIIGGYVFALILGVVDFTAVQDVFSQPIIGGWFAFPEFYLPFKFMDFNTYNIYFGPEVWAIIPIAFVTIAEHIGDHTVLGKICGSNFIKEPGLDKTIRGDGIATAVSAFLGGPANTTYGENTGVVGLTKVGSVYVIFGAACIAILLSFFRPLTVLIQTIPTGVLGGMSILLYGVIASNGLRVLVESKVDFSKQRNLIIASAMLVVGLGGAVLKLSNLVSLQGMALAAIVGIVLNLILPKE